MATNNGTTTRKSLASQLDRLDSILDGLAENLNEAVATAVTETVGKVVCEAMRVGFREITTDPAIASVLHGMSMPPAALIFDREPIRPADPPRFAAFTKLLTDMQCRAARRWQQVRAWAALVWEYRAHILAALVVAVLLVVAGYWAGLIVCGAFLVGVVASAGGVTIFRSWCQPQGATIQPNTCSAVSPMPVPSASTSPTAAAV